MLLDVAATKISNLLLCARHAADSRLLQEQTEQYKEELLHQLVDSIAAEVTLSTPDGEIVFVNRTCMEHTGLPVGAHFDWANGEVLHPEDIPRVKEAWARAVATGGTYEVDVRARWKGVYRWM